MPNPLRSVVIIALGLLVVSAGAGFRPVEPPPDAGVLDEVWNHVNERFFDPEFNGVDWQAVGERYRNHAQAAESRSELAAIINQMLAELNTSHTYFYTADDPHYYAMMDIFYGGRPLNEAVQQIFPEGEITVTGLRMVTKEIDGHSFIAEVMGGGPAQDAGLLAGDEIINVDGAPFHPIRSFVDRAGESVVLSIRRAGPDDAPRDVVATPVAFVPHEAYLDTMVKATRVVKRDGRRLAYIRIFSYAGEQYQQQLLHLLRAPAIRAADGLVLDIRGGRGGAHPNFLNAFNPDIPGMEFIGRDGVKYPVDVPWRKPVVLLVDEGSRSGKEILAYGFKRYNIGTVVGTKTRGAVVGGGPFMTSDHSLLYLAVVDVLIDGRRIEGVGVTPDVVVEYPLPYSQGHDPQLEKALDVLVGEIGETAAKRSESQLPGVGGID